MSSSPRVWLVIGSSSGLGREMCNHALESGDHVVATLHKQSDIEQLGSKYGQDRLAKIQLDVTNDEHIHHAFAVAKERFGRVDVVFNNAGSAIVGEVEGVPEEDARKLMDVKFWGATAVSKAAVRFFREENPPHAGGLLLNISSELGLRYLPTMAYYAAAKHALEGLTESLAAELDPSWNIKISLVVCSAFKTANRAKALIEPGFAPYAKVGSVSAVRQYIKNGDDPKTPHVDDIANAVKRIYNYSKSGHIQTRLFLGTQEIERLQNYVGKVSADLEASKSWSEGLIEDECLVM